MYVSWDHGKGKKLTEYFVCLILLLKYVVLGALMVTICDENLYDPRTLGGGGGGDTVEVSGQCQPRVQPIFWLFIDWNRLMK